jgi:uncharacterized repeat protein (TIGR01451 family)
MNLRNYAKMGDLRQRLRRLGRFFLALSMLVTALAPLAPTLAPPALAGPADAPLAQTNTLQLSVISARTESRAFGSTGVVKGDAVTQYKYIINIDNTGTTEQRSPSNGCSPDSPGYPGSCNWVSIAGAASNSPIYAQGNQDDFANGGLNLPDGRYLISVLADGYKLDGAHFTVPLADPGLVTVELQPFPLPDATIRAFVFEDISPTNSAPDVPAEQGLAGFTGHIVDYLGEVTTDIYGNPLCTLYEGEDPVTHVIPPQFLDADQLPVVAVVGGGCVSDANGELVIPHVGPNRYALSAVPPDGSGWIQTTTLEGNHDWDAWVMEGATGYDTEFVVAGEPFPPIFFGFVQPTNNLSGGSGTIKGVVDAFKTYVPGQGGLVGYDPIAGSKVDHPIDGPWLSLVDLLNGDTAVWIGQGGADGSFQINNVPDGNYSLAFWDEPQDYILNFTNVTVANGEVVDLGILPLSGWWTQLDGYVFSDDNRNGVMDWQDLNGDGCPTGGAEGEAGLANFPLTMRKRENSLMDRGATLVTTDGCGHYYMENAYPMTQWLVMEAYSDLYYTTGVTYQADNQPSPTTVLGAGVDVSVLPIIGLSGRMDWGVHAYDPTGANGVDPRNGGIVGTVSYDTTRNEIDPQYAAVEDWQPGISGLTVNLYATIPCGTNAGTPCSTGPGLSYELAPDGSYAKGALLNTYVTETWERPGNNCVPRDVNGDPLLYPTDQQVTNSDTDCLEGPLMGVQFGTYATDQGTPDANFGAAVDGNYGFGDGCFAPNVFDPAAGTCTDANDPTITDAFTPLPGGRDYLVQVEIPNDATGRPVYQVTKEEDINIANGDQFIPQVPPPACSGPLHTVDVAGIGTDVWPEIVGDGTNGVPVGVTVPASTPVVNATFADELNGSYYEGQPRPLCDTKLVQLNNGKSIVPTFNLFTDVPLPGRFWGLLVDDLNFSSNPKSLLYGEKAGVPFAPVGIYDWTNRLVTTVESDYNGLFDVLLPSSNRINCPTPSGVCANLYRLVGNDPGIPGRLNLNFNPQFRTIAAEFEAIPGLIVPADLAPTQMGATVQLPGTQTLSPVACMVNDPAQPPTTPELFAVSRPYVTTGNASNRTITITGQGFGTTQGAGTVTLNGTPITVNSWTDTQIVVEVPSSFSGGVYQLEITAGNGRSTVNGLTIHFIKGSYTPTVFEVGPGRPYATIQSAIDAVAANNPQFKALVVVYPGVPDPANPRYNPRGAYYENLILYRPMKLQGVGPGGVIAATNTTVPGSIIDGSAFGGDTALADAWRARIAGMAWVGNQTVSEGEVIYVLAEATGDFTSGGRGSANSPHWASIDGFDIRGGDQQGVPNTITQGGAIFANAYVQNLQITNNVIEANNASYGTVRIGTPDLPAPDTSQHNEGLNIANNRIIANAGTNLAGAIGIFAGADNYQVAYNDICGNFSAEYGGGISHYGLSPNGSIHDNRVYYNQSYDEGGGIMIAGQLPADPATLSPGSGPVNIYNNLIQGNLANDDGGGLRFLMAGNFPMDVYNNMIVNNVSTHEGGGVALNDAPNVRFYNNTVMKNITTATALTSNGLPAPAGLSSSANSDLLQATLPAGSTSFSNPLLFNDIFWDNRAGTRGVGTVTGLSDADANVWDLGVADGTGTLSPTNSIVQMGDGGPMGSDPQVVSMYNTEVTFAAWRTNPNFVGAILVTAATPPNLLGDYHLSGTGSPAYNAGAASKAVPSYQQPPDTLPAPAFDFDNQMRMDNPDIGADEYYASTSAGFAPAIGEPAPVAQADLALSLVDAVDPVTQGDNITYSLSVTNNGPDSALNVALTDTLPQGLSFVSALPSLGSCFEMGGEVICSLGDIPSGGGAGVELVVTATATGTLTNSASVSSDTADPNSADNSASQDTSVDPAPAPVVEPTPVPEAQADLGLSMADAVDPAMAGDLITYTLAISNAGPDSALNVVLTDSLPGGVTFVSATPTQGSCLEADGLLTCSLGDMDSGASAGMELVITTTLTGTLTNSASLSSDTADPNAENNSAGQDTTVDAAPAPVVEPTPTPVVEPAPVAEPQADLALSMVDAMDPVRVRDNITYTLGVSNNGPDAALSVVLTDSLPGGVTFVSATPTQGSCLEADGVLTCSLGDMDSGASAGVELVITTTEAGVITNNASLSSDTADPNPADNSAGQDTTVQRRKPK